MTELLTRIPEIRAVECQHKAVPDYRLRLAIDHADQRHHAVTAVVRFILNAVIIGMVQPPWFGVDTDGIEILQQGVFRFVRFLVLLQYQAAFGAFCEFTCEIEELADPPKIGLV